MLSLLLDEHLSPKVAAGLIAQHPSLPVVALAHWQGGRYLGVPDDVLLAAAYQSAAYQAEKIGEAEREGQPQGERQTLTLVTYDLRTITPLFKEWGEQGQAHGGVIFIDERTLAPNNFGGLIGALAQLWLAQGEWDWTDRVVFLRR